jgi:hypothetical protein
VNHLEKVSKVPYVLSIAGAKIIPESLLAVTKALYDEPFDVLTGI